MSTRSAGRPGACSGLLVALTLAAVAGGLACANGTGADLDAGLGCQTAATCPGADTECRQRACVDHLCGFAGVAAGTPIAAQTVGDCQRDECDGAGGVITVADDTDVPDDGNDCTADSCHAGAPLHDPRAAGTTCGGGMVCDAAGNCTACVRDADCPASTNECLTPVCHAGACGTTPVPDGTGCDDGDPCTRIDTCQAGLCTGASPVVCPAADECHDGVTCDPATGACPDGTKPDGTTCSDGNACTESDTCQAGVCTGGAPKVCTALDECHTAGTCDTGTGLCSTPEKPLGTLCTGGYCSAGVCTPATHGTATFDYTGAVQQFTVPLGITSVSFTVYGAQGRTNVAGAVAGGLGGRATGTLSVTPGATLNVYVGGGGGASLSGGYNGGGNAGSSGCASAEGGGGGGASDVRVGGTALANRVIVAGGGGGAGGERISGCGRGTGGGGGGGYYGGGGGAAYPASSTVVPTGGTQSAGGAGGVSTAGLAADCNGYAGVSGVGGRGGNEISSAQAGTNVAAAGGTGGGTTGAAGAYTGNFTGQSGAGGSGYVGGVTGGALTNGIRSGNGQVVITY